MHGDRDSAAGGPSSRSHALAFAAPTVPGRSRAPCLDLGAFGPRTSSSSTSAAVRTRRATAAAAPAEHVNVYAYGAARRAHAPDRPPRELCASSSSFLAGCVRWAAPADACTRPAARALRLVCSASEQDAASLAEKLSSPKPNVRLMGLVALPRAALSPQSYELVAGALGDESILVRCAALNALGSAERLADPEVRGAAAERLERELMEQRDSRARAEAAASLGKLGLARSLAPLRRTFYEEPDWTVRLASMIAIGSLQCPEAAEVIAEGLKPGDVPELQKAAVNALRKLGPAAVAPHVPRILELASECAGEASAFPVRWKVAETLSDPALLQLLDAPTLAAAGETLRRLRGDGDPKVAAAAEAALAAWEGAAGGRA